MKPIGLAAFLLALLVSTGTLAQSVRQQPDSLAATAQDTAGIAVDSTLSQPVAGGGDRVVTAPQTGRIERYLVPALITVVAGVVTWLLFTVRSS